MADKEDNSPAKKMLTLLKKEKSCSCGCDSCVKKAAISTLGQIGSNFKRLRPSAINPSDISSKPMKQKQLGQQDNNMYLNNNSSITPVNNSVLR